MKSLLPVPEIGQRILFVRGQRVMLDSDLAKLYGVPTKRLNEQVRRNTPRFPNDFMFRLTAEEAVNLMSHFATSSLGWGGHRKLPLVFTQEGVAMLSGILRSERAIQVNIAIMRAFVRLREVLSTHSELAKRLEQAESRLADHDAVLGQHADEIRAVFEAIRQLIQPPARPRRRIGFNP